MNKEEWFIILTALLTYILFIFVARFIILYGVLATRYLFFG